MTGKVTTSTGTKWIVPKLKNATPPAPPKSLDQLDIPESVVSDIAVRFLCGHSASSLTQLRKTLRLSHGVADEIFHSLRDQRLVEIKRTLVGGDYLFALTAEGSKLAAAKSETCRYAGPVPVSLRHYAQVVQAQRRTARTTPQQLRDALADLVIADRTIDQLDTAILSHRPLFIYGPAGNGKTSIMERLPRIYDDSVLIPHAVLRDHARITSHLAAGPCGARTSCVQRRHFPETTLSRSCRFTRRLSNLQAELMRAFDDGSNLLFPVPGFVVLLPFIDVFLPVLE